VSVCVAICVCLCVSVFLCVSVCLCVSACLYVRVSVCLCAIAMVISGKYYAQHILAVVGRKYDVLYILLPTLTLVLNLYPRKYMFSTLKLIQ
jgi:Na+/H+ antiporter NhaD/arsenite permease-like protein